MVRLPAAWVLVSASRLRARPEQRLVEFLATSKATKPNVLPFVDLKKHALPEWAALGGGDEGSFFFMCVSVCVIVALFALDDEASEAEPGSTRELAKAIVRENGKGGWQCGEEGALAPDPRLDGCVSGGSFLTCQLLLRLAFISVGVRNWDA